MPLNSAFRRQISEFKVCLKHRASFITLQSYTEKVLSKTKQHSHSDAQRHAVSKNKTNKHKEIMISGIGGTYL